MHTNPTPSSTGKLTELSEELRLVLTGRGSLLDAILPGILFMALNALFNFTTAIWGSLALAGVFAIIRLVQRGSILYVGLGLAGAGLTALLSQANGLEGYILPDVITGVLSIGTALVSVLMGRPLVAWTSHFIRRWPRAWYWHAQVRPAYTEVTLAWAVFFAARLALEVALTQSQNGLLLSLAKWLGGWPATILLLIASYLYGLWRLRQLRGPSVEEFQEQTPPPWQSQRRGF